MLSIFIYIMYKKTNSSTKDNKNIQNFIFREYKNKDDKFIATNNFYFYGEFDERIGFFSLDNDLIHTKIIPYNENLYILKSIKDNNNSLIDKYIDLILISNISFLLEDININKTEIIKRFIEKDELIDEKLFEDLYFNENFSKKINIELPKKYNDKKVILENIEINKKYLFRINFIELNYKFNEENKFNNLEQCVF